MIKTPCDFAHQTKKRAYMLTVSIFAMTSNSYAALLNWTDPSPNPLQPFEQQVKSLATLTGQDITIYSHPVQAITLNTVSGLKTYNNAQFSSSAVILNVPMQQVADFFKTPQRFIGTFPTLTSAKLLEHNLNNSEIQVKYHVSIPTPLKILNFNEDVVMQHRYDANGMTTTVIASPLPIGVGKIQWYALEGNRTLVTLTQWTDVNTVKGFLVRTMLNALPEAKAGIPYGANAFIMEALKQKFNAPTPVPIMAAGVVPEKSLNSEQYQHIIKISQDSAQPVEFVQPSVAIPYQQGSEPLRFTSSYQYYSAPSQRTISLLNPSIYQQLFPKLIKKIDSVRIDNRSVDTTIKGGAGLGILNIPFNLRMRVTTLTPSSTDMYAIGGDLKYVRQRMSVTPYGQGSVLHTNTALKVDADAPYLLRIARSMPYYDMLPAATLARVLHAQIKTKLGF